MPNHMFIERYGRNVFLWDGSQVNEGGPKITLNP